MPEVAFHTGLSDKIGYTCRLLRKASRQGLRVRVIGGAADLELLDKALWTFDAQDFVAHVRLVDGVKPASALRRTTLWLTQDPAAWPEGVDPPQVLVNLGLELPDEVSAYERLVEIVSDEPGDRAAGRRRWRQYEARGLAIKHFPAPPSGNVL
jgi:DNA polymerase III subunit chi